MGVCNCAAYQGGSAGDANNDNGGFGLARESHQKRYPIALSTVWHWSERIA